MWEWVNVYLQSKAKRTISKLVKAKMLQLRRGSQISFFFFVRKIGAPSGPFVWVFLHHLLLFSTNGARQNPPWAEPCLCDITRFLAHLSYCDHLLSVGVRPSVRRPSVHNFLVNTRASTNINQSAPNLVKMYKS